MKSKEYVLKTKVVASDDNSRCYEITRELVGEQGEHVILITLYPSYSASTEALHIDATGNCLINHMHQMGINKLTMVFLFTKKTRGEKISTRNLEPCTEGVEYLEKLLKKSEYKDAKVVIGIGGSMKKNKSAIETRRMLFQSLKKHNRELYQLSCEGITTQSEYGLHPLFLSCKAKLLEWSLSSYTYVEKGENKGCEGLKVVSVTEQPIENEKSIYRKEKKQ